MIAHSFSNCTSRALCRITAVEPDNLDSRQRTRASSHRSGRSARFLAMATARLEGQSSLTPFFLALANISRRKAIWTEFRAVRPRICLCVGLPSKQSGSCLFAIKLSMVLMHFSHRPQW